MNASERENAATTAALLEGLRQQAEGLYYVSETDAPFVVVHFPAMEGNEPTAAELTSWAGMPAGEKTETVTLAAFFRNQVTETPDMGEEDRKMAQRFQQLQAFLAQHLQDVKVYRVGARRKTALVLGRTRTGNLAGLKTQLVET
ncbi:nuclease A inhibitor family protein [Pontibacter liquoris]|uniref:nuclease A inhibitor family protein n=1 Tax=Pontibacter liquoris TaxID=2905677 RepID=UPI001FA79EBF|nr:nuclease A inhibitor family protein [Pontibacter liquoris]